MQKCFQVTINSINTAMRREAGLWLPEVRSECLYTCCLGTQSLSLSSLASAEEGGEEGG